MINEFQGEYRFLSNFFHSPFVWEGKEYATVEHAYQAWKVEPEHQETIRKSQSAALSKKLGRKFPMREAAKDEQSRILAMYRFLFAKFTQNPELGFKLLETGEQDLVEGNHWGDKFWGVCDGEGKNHLGNLLMGLRSTLNEIQKIPSY
jgi:ribA/ribD-fused uncharacterized protein